MSAESTASRGVPTDNRFKVWRQTRPFWAGLFTMIGGVPIAYLPYGDMRLGNMTLAMQTTAGAGALIIGVLLITLGLTMWFQPAVRVFAGVATIVLGLISIPVSNFGGLVIGFLFALVGGGMSASWAPAPPAKTSDEQPEQAEQSVPEEQDEAAPAEPGEHHAYDEHDGTTGTTQPLIPQQGSEAPVAGKTIEANGGRNSAG
ncbi:DUF6114 domain-containing protein [Streptomyces roseicoloratus]|uniref:DUF6114 domain-containing protein n=1 Tax=Streptomyces roseicoloratus TaxID=2508722 RepID=A0ABY9RS20_9ACTN|nr:DUF6114 domain-containing protein [Streptomyces roseicoloratus]WMX44979.1 DUF6114 domain-containing protein [Streptomyces roseicoloratus]